MGVDREVDDIDELGAPNCPVCLESMEPAVGAWWCEACRVSRSP